ncbi:MAG TPA: hypothetical protein VJZ27_20840, partial [Aggregatilineales bacterium]|nr:hypothetical protein [Aggregatilineales bacterium]
LQEDDLVDIADVVIVPIGDVHRGTLMALQYAKRISTDVRAICISTNPALHERFERRWNRFPEVTDGIKLDIIDYDYRDILSPLVDYIERVNTEDFPHQLITIIIPEFIPSERSALLLHNQTANLLRNRLIHKDDIIIIEVPYHI